MMFIAGRIRARALLLTAGVGHRATLDSLGRKTRATRERISALAALAVPDAILVSFYSSRLRLASPLAQRRRDRDPRGRPALLFLSLHPYLGFPEIREEPNPRGDEKRKGPDFSGPFAIPRQPS